MEQYDYKTNQTQTVEKLNDYIRKSGYNFSGVGEMHACKGDWMDGGYCITPSEDASYYTVTVYVSVSLPFFNLDFTFPIRGESKSYDV